MVGADTMEKNFISRNSLFIFVLCSFSCLGLVGTVGNGVELSAPKLISFPSSVNYFSNSVGLTLSCVATGLPPLGVKWLSVDSSSGGGEGEELVTIPGLRQQLDNGSLHFSPFRVDEYMSHVHAGKYRCSARNSLGVALSPVFHVNAVIDEQFQVSVRSSGGLQQQNWLEGNPALLECHVTNPPGYNQFTHVIAWKEIDQFGHEREIRSGDYEKYLMTAPYNKLLILQAPSQRLFVCVVQNMLNKQTRSSAPFLFKSKSTSPPMAPQPYRDAETATNKILIMQDQSISPQVTTSSIDLICLVTGSPVPMWRWEKLEETSKRWLPVGNSGIAKEIGAGPLLRLTFGEENEINDHINGTYRCEASNPFGTATSEYSVEIVEKPRVVVRPKRVVPYPGESVLFSCFFSGNNQNFQNGKFVWYKNGKLLMSSGRVKVSDHELKIIKVRLEDQGVYQCSGENDSVGFAELTFPPTAAELVHTFISQSVQPGAFISLKCSAMGNPTPVISWFIDDLIVSSSNSARIQMENDEEEGKYLWMSEQQRNRFHFSEESMGKEVVSYLNISTIRVEDSGMYKCTASNLLRAVSHSARLNVFGSIFVREMVGAGPTYAHGDTVYMPCRYGGYPVDKIIWQKDSRNLISSLEIDNHGNNAGDDRISMFPNGTLRISEISAESSTSDKGRYTCVVSNRNGEIASGSLTINVMHPPIISAFKFEDTLNEGQRTSAVCNVISGDLPIKTSWLKDSLPIPRYLNITENTVRFLSVLLFDELQEAHSGEYTCIAENPARLVKQSATLLVRVSPKWIRPPQNTKAVLGSEHTLECRAKGVPSPTFSWFRESNGLRVPLSNNHKINLLFNGTLLKIKEIQESDGGLYTCQAENGVGSLPITHTATLDVIIPARITGSKNSSPAVVEIAEGAPTTLSCQIHGDRPLQVTWKKDSVLLLDEQTTSSSRGFLLERNQKVVEVNSSVISAELRIEASSLQDSGIYECMASNQYGRDEKKIKLQVKARPVAPEDLMVEEIGSRFIRLKWSPSSSSADPITHFLVQWKQLDGSSPSSSFWKSENNVTVAATVNEAVVENLIPVTNYAIRLFTQTRIGQSLPTQPLHVLTLAEPPSGTPLNVSATPIGPKSVFVRWKPPDVTRQHGTILGYHVTASLHNSVVSGSESVSVEVKLLEEVKLEGLRPNSQYRISVSAFNSAGQGPDSPFLFIQTPEGAPDAPPMNVQCESLSPKSVMVHWEPPPEQLQNGNILGYKVLYVSVDGERLAEKPEVKKTSNRETTLHGLRSFTSYSVKVLAYTVGGESEPSRAVHCSTEEDVPDEPANVKVTCSGENSVVVSWLPPRVPNGVITKYTVFWRQAENGNSRSVVKDKSFVLGASTSNSGQFSKEIKGLEKNVEYKFWVSAVTGAGNGKPSKMESILLSPNGTPQIASFSVIKSVIVGESVKLPCLVFAAGGTAPKIVWLKDHHSIETRRIWRNGTLHIARVRDSDEGLYTCRAENENGSDEIEHQIIISRPPGRVSLLVGYVTHSSIQVHWDPSTKVHPPLLGYLLEWRADSTGDQQWTAVKLADKLQSYVLEDLRCGTKYQIRIAGVNEIGRGMYSEILTSRTNGQLPDEKPRLTEILDGNGTMIRIDLFRWPDGGCPIKNYHVEYRNLNGSSWTQVVQKEDSLASTSRVFTLQTAINSRYEIQVKVENDAGLVTKRFLVESHPNFFRNYAKVLERVEMGEADTEGKNNVVPFYTDPHVIVPIVSAFICTAAAAVCLLMVLVRRRNLRKQASQSPSEWKFTGGGGAVVAQGARQNQQSWLNSSAEGGSDLKCSGDLTEGGEGSTESTSIYATLNSTKPIPMTIRESTVRLHSFGSFDNYDAAPLTNTHESMIPAGGQYLKKVKRKSSASSPITPTELCMQQVLCPVDFSAAIEPPHEFRSTSSAGEGGEGNYTRNEGRSMEDLYHDYSYPYHDFPKSCSSNEMLHQKDAHHHHHFSNSSSNANTLKKSSSRKFQAGEGSKRNSRTDNFFH